MYRTRTVQIKQTSPLFKWCANICFLSNNLYNRALFIERQIYSSSRKNIEDYSENEMEVMESLRDHLGVLSCLKTMPSSERPYLTYYELEEYLRITKDIDFYADGLPRQTAQQVVRQVCQDMRSYFSASHDFFRSPTKYNCRPKLPRYHPKKALCTATITNQVCSIIKSEDRMSAKVPMSKERIQLGTLLQHSRFVELHVHPKKGVFSMAFVFEITGNNPYSAYHFDQHRIAAIDLGIENIVSITNNVGAPSLIIKGGVIKSINQYYNKRIKNSYCCKSFENLSLKQKKELRRITQKRNNQVNDYMFKLACAIIDWLVQYQIGTLVIGVNKRWKQHVNIGAKCNQIFVQIPFYRLRTILRYKCDERHIQYIEQEESYTSQASFLDCDRIPSFKSQDINVKFSGKRAPSTDSFGHSKNSGYRGLYLTGNGTLINSDLNGSANILRKAFPDAFDGPVLPSFDHVLVIRYPGDLLTSHS